jgi:hypothetical protein
MKMDFNIIFTSTPRYSRWSPSIRLPLHNPTCTSLLSCWCHTPGPSNFSWFVHPNICWVQIR